MSSNCSNFDHQRVRQQESIRLLVELRPSHLAMDTPSLNALESKLINNLVLPKIITTITSKQLLRVEPVEVNRQSHLTMVMLNLLPREDHLINRMLPSKIINKTDINNKLLLREARTISSKIKNMKIANQLSEQTEDLPAAQIKAQ